MSTWKLIFGMLFLVSSLFSGSLGFFEKDGWFLFLNFNLFMTLIMIIPLYCLYKGVNIVKIKLNKKGEADE